LSSSTLSRKGGKGGKGGKFLEKKPPGDQALGVEREGRRRHQDLLKAGGKGKPTTTFYLSVERGGEEGGVDLRGPLRSWEGEEEGSLYQFPQMKKGNGMTLEENRLAPVSLS